MNGESGAQEVNGNEPEDALRETSRQARIEQRVQDLFRLAGNGTPAQQLMRLVIKYRLAQQR